MIIVRGLNKITATNVLIKNQAHGHDVTIIKRILIGRFNTILKQIMTQWPGTKLRPTAGGNISWCNNGPIHIVYEFFFLTIYFPIDRIFRGSVTRVA